MNLIQRHVCRQTPAFIKWAGVCADAVSADVFTITVPPSEGAVG